MNRYSTAGKLVRDRIPQIIREDGAEPIVRTAGPEEYRRRLRDKLGEEVAEFLAADEAGALEELADVLEVVRTLAADLGAGPAQLEKVREAKARERGGFAERVVWAGNR
ncbi:MULTISPECIES: nucleoside triphosphate pyrophosphohydrolase [Streptomyces]|uniref:Nucleoside triphosphate pyrophosphohydrolase n=1 Tax=Streptomyces ramulosus TaxID=47762 RepID=A0ABW1FDA8_9ACTN